VTDRSFPLPRDLGEGLRLRTATAADADALAAFNGDTHADESGQPDAAIAVWTRDLLTRPHPTFRPDLFTVVEEVSSGRIVSSLNLIPQTWSYGGVEFGVGRIELVGTHPDFRRRGLVRCQMEVAHQWSHDLGHLLQGITGIPWYYRQFGYEMALDLGGSRSVPVTEIPTRPASEPEPYRLRPATPDDIPLLLRADDQDRRRSLLTSVRDASWWHYEIAGRSEAADEQNRFWIVERAGAGAGVGFVSVDAVLRGSSLLIRACEIEPGATWVAIVPSLLRALRNIGDSSAREAAAAEDRTAAAAKTTAGCDRLVFRVGAEHPLYAALPSRMKDARPPFAWYVRVPDLPAFLRRVAPVLEARLAASPAAGYSGELRLWFSTSGLRLSFADGHLVDAAPWPEGTPDEADASFPPLTFLHLLCGHRSLADLEYAFADCYADADEARVVLDALFPKRPSFVLPLG